jgi:uncharacterized protein
VTPLAQRLERLAPQPAAPEARRAVVDELRRRMKRLEDRPAVSPARLPPGPIYARALPQPLRELGDAAATEFGARFTTVFAPSTRVGTVAPGELRGGSDRVAGLLAGLAGPAPPGLLAGLRIVDIETTGLSGGTGTLAFLVGVGRFVDGAFVVEQVLLGSPAHETAFLDALRALLGDGALLVSFNGRSFDVPLLRTRTILARATSPRCPLSTLPHLDLITPARRLWRGRAEDCRLVSLEAAVLRRRRPDDIPGMMAPQAYGDFLRSGDARLLAKIVAHNRDDVAGTAALLAHALRILDDPFTHAEEPGELIAAAEHRLRHAGAEAALPVAARALELSRGRAEVRRALVLLARLHRRLGALPEVEAAWRRYLDAFPNENRAYVELAKIYEHRRRDPAAALALARAAPHGALDEIERRVARLARRVSGVR